jgi:hypothetical protein
MWVANIDSSLVSTTDAYTCKYRNFCQLVLSALNLSRLVGCRRGIKRRTSKGSMVSIRPMGSYSYALTSLSRSTIGSGDTTKDGAEELVERLSLTYTLISIQSFLGTILSVVFLFAAPAFVGAFVPGQVRATSVRYVRILAFDSLASTVNVAVSFGTRALDKPEQVLKSLSEWGTYQSDCIIVYRCSCPQFRQPYKSFWS